MTVLNVFTHPDCALHDPVPGHPERPERLAAALDGIEQLDEYTGVEARPITPEQLARVHDQRYLDRLDSIAREIECGRATVALDADTHVGPDSLHAAALAAGAACQAVDHCLSASRQVGFAVVRPPGHHAEAATAMGFCLYNSIAVAAAHALDQPGIRRVAICDFDVHHGNGTEAIFAGRNDVLFASSHQFPLYPGTGDPHKRHSRNTHNFGLPPGSGSDEFRNAWKARLLDRIDRFSPDLILISAGFDAHWRDPLAQLNLKDEDYFWIGHQLKIIADQHCDGRLAASLEGGYDLKALTDSVLAFSEGITFTH